MNVSTRTLIITQSYMAHQIVSLDRALSMLFCGKIDSVVESYGDELGTIREHRMRDFPHVCRAYGREPGDGLGDLALMNPCVARMSRSVPRIKRAVKFSRINVFTRDGFRCQYCRERKNMEDLNYDHVQPRIMGGRTVWDNIVSSCYPCNSRKAGRTPAQAGMPLLKAPVKPKWLPMVGPRFSPSDASPQWMPYLGSAFSDERVA
jgi:hypothetical protein